MTTDADAMQVWHVARAWYDAVLVSLCVCRCRWLRRRRRHWRRLLFWPAVSFFSTYDVSARR